jgi:hypothetical protein
MLSGVTVIVICFLIMGFLNSGSGGSGGGGCFFIIIGYIHDGGNGIFMNFMNGLFMK